MAASPRLISIIAVIVALLTGTIAFFDHSSFLGGVVVGVGIASTLILFVIAFVRVKLESQMEDFAAGMNIDINQLLGRGETKE